MRDPDKMPRWAKALISFELVLVTCLGCLYFLSKQPVAVETFAPADLEVSSSSVTSEQSQEESKEESMISSIPESLSPSTVFEPEPPKQERYVDEDAGLSFPVPEGLTIAPKSALPEDAKVAFYNVNTLQLDFQYYSYQAEEIKTMLWEDFVSQSLAWINEIAANSQYYESVISNRNFLFVKSEIVSAFAGEQATVSNEVIFVFCPYNDWFLAFGFISSGETSFNEDAIKDFISSVDFSVSV